MCLHEEPGNIREDDPQDDEQKLCEQKRKLRREGLSENSLNYGQATEKFYKSPNMAPVQCPCLFGQDPISWQEKSKAGDLP